MLCKTKSFEMLLRSKHLHGTVISSGIPARIRREAHRFESHPPVSKQKSKKVRIRILNPISGCGHTSLAHARRYVKRGVAEWVSGAIRFLPKDTPVLAVDPRESPDYRPNDSGQSGFARYPMPLMVSNGSAFRALAQPGAGL